MPDPLPENISLEPMPFQEAIEYFGDKVPMTADEFRALWDEAKARAFTVSRVAQMDIIMDLRTAVERAIADGETLADFQARLGSIMEAQGWKGLTPWHTETVFRNNIQTAYSVGRYRQMAGHGDRIYGEYDAVNDAATRPTHAALDGRIFPMDHPFWNTWWPPNGHRCRCSVNPVHRAVVEEEGLTVETDDPTGTMVEPTDPATGQRMLPRYLLPDPGWDSHPGKTAWQPDLKKYPKALRGQFEAEKRS